MKTFLQFSFILLISLNGWLCFGQKTNSTFKISDLAISIGPSHISLNDPVFTPIIYRGTGFSTELQYSNYTLKRKHNIVLHFSSTSLSSPLNKMTLNTINSIGGFLNYDYQRKVKQGKWNFYFGGGFHSFFSLRTLRIRAVAEEVGVDIFPSLNLLGSFNRQFNEKHFLELKVSYPIVAYVVGRMRIPQDFPEEVYRAISNDQDAKPAGAFLKSGDFLSITKFVDILSTVKYQYTLSNRFSANAVYRFRYYQYPKFLDVKYGTSQFLFGLSYKFLK